VRDRRVDAAPARHRGEKARPSSVSSLT
jgi:hypothetical protein